jgi:3-oxoacyl-[acyl-carrier-protein] synthase-1
VQRHDLLVGGAPVFVAQVEAPVRKTPKRLAAYASRNLGLTILAVEEIRSQTNTAIARYGPHRVAVVMGTSTSGIAQGEDAVAYAKDNGHLPGGFDVRMQELGSTGEALARYLGVTAPAYTISTACSSGAHALAAARRLLRIGIADAVLAGGADSICRLTTNGFQALSALSAGICNPFSRNRDGTMIGEGAAIFLVQREPSEIALFGVGTSSDAYSMTAPEPEGRGIESAIRGALTDAGIIPSSIDYINLHGTGTRHNDEVESKVIQRVFGASTPCSSSKAQIGHTLGAAGAMGAAHCWLAASDINKQRHLPPHIWDGQVDEGLISDCLVKHGEYLGSTAPRIFLCNAFGFGGSNVSLVMGRAR